MFRAARAKISIHLVQDSIRTLTIFRYVLFHITHTATERLDALATTTLSSLSDITLVTEAMFVSLLEGETLSVALFRIDFAFLEERLRRSACITL